jgi:hypothetical protein
MVSPLCCTPNVVSLAWDTRRYTNSQSNTRSNLSAYARKQRTIPFRESVTAVSHLSPSSAHEINKQIKFHISYGRPTSAKTLNSFTLFIWNITWRMTCRRMDPATQPMSLAPTGVFACRVDQVTCRALHMLFANQNLGSESFAVCVTGSRVPSKGRNIRYG